MGNALDLFSNQNLRGMNVSEFIVRWSNIYHRYINSKKKIKRLKKLLNEAHIRVLRASNDAARLQNENAKLYYDKDATRLQKENEQLREIVSRQTRIIVSYENRWKREKRVENEITELARGNTNRDPLADFRPPRL